MVERMRHKINGIRSAFKMFFLDIIDMKSTRIQLLWGTFFAWFCGIVYFGMIVPIIRELSIIYYRQNSIVAVPINLDSPHASTILGMLGAAFMATVAGYIVSNLKTYAKQDPNYSLKKIEKLTENKIDEEP